MATEKAVEFDGMRWPLPDSDLAWKARYGKPTQTEMYWIASRLEAYAHLIEHTQKRRNYICKRLKGRGEAGGLP